VKRLRKLLGLGGEAQLRVLMVCSGNICRSPTAEAVLRAKLEGAGLGGVVEVDSAGTHGFHIKEPPDPRAQQHARRRGYDLSSLRSRSVTDRDFEAFDWMLAMDQGHLDWLQEAAPAGARARLALLMEHALQRRDQREVPDPYYGSPQSFELVLDLVEDACDGFVRHLRNGGLRDSH